MNEEYLDSTYNDIKSLISKDKLILLKDIKNNLMTNDSNNYLYSVSASTNTLVIFEFHNEKCTSFYIQSFEDRFSLPYWNYSNEYKKHILENSNIDFNEVSIEYDRYLLSEYTTNRFLEDYDKLGESFPDDGFYFKYQYRVNEKRFLSISFDYPKYFPKSNYPLYVYLCSNNIESMKNFRTYLKNIYPDLLYQYIVDVKKISNSLKNNN